MKPEALPQLRFRRLWILVGIMLMVFIALLSLMPPEQLPVVRLSDKIKHIMAYVLLAFWFGSLLPRNRFLRIALALILYGVLIELLQASMGRGRMAELLDVGANVVGIAGGLLLSLTPAGRWPHWLESLQRQPAR